MYALSSPVVRLSPLALTVALCPSLSLPVDLKLHACRSCVARIAHDKDACDTRAKQCNRVSVTSATLYTTCAGRGACGQRLVRHAKGTQRVVWDRWAPLLAENTCIMITPMPR